MTDVFKLSLFIRFVLKNIIFFRLSFKKEAHNLALILKVQLGLILTEAQLKNQEF
jgi:hypothetical protein